MTRLEVQGEDLVAHVEGIGSKLMALGPRIRVPLKTVTDVRSGAPELFRRGLWVRAFGASFIRRHVGYFWRKSDGISFVDVNDLHSRERIVAIDLDGAHLRHLYIEPSDGTAREVAERIRRELRA